MPILLYTVLDPLLGLKPMNSLANIHRHHGSAGFDTFLSTDGSVETLLCRKYFLS